MGYKRRRAGLVEIERLCSQVLLAYEESAMALKADEADRFWQSLELLRATAEQLSGLLWPTAAENGFADWLDVSELSPLHPGGPPFLHEPRPSMPLDDCARFLDGHALPALLTAVAELSHRAQERTAYLRQVV